MDCKGNIKSAYFFLPLHFIFLFQRVQDGPIFPGPLVILEPFFFIPILLVVYYLKVATEMHIQLLHWFVLHIMFLDAEGADISQDKCQAIMTLLLTVSLKSRIISVQKIY